MSLALLKASSLKPHVRLGVAISEFEASLSGEQKARFRTFRGQAQGSPLNIDDVFRLTAEVDRQVRRSGSMRSYGPRFTNLLQTIQHFAALGDILIGGSQNLIACGVWSLVRLTILAITTSSSTLEKFSMLFMSIGRSSPRYQGLASLYTQSRVVQECLAEYLIVVIQICQQFYEFSQKSAIMQITNSLNSVKITKAEADLQFWAENIKDEVSFLNARATEREADNMNDFRSWMTLKDNTLTRYKKMEKRVQWLSAFSKYDYETPWKQARKRGSTAVFADLADYQEWRSENKSSTLVLSGKMGSGKSVMMANIVDDLNIHVDKGSVIYFFCRHDIADSLKARTLFGSLARQILVRYVSNELMDDVLGSHVQVLDLEGVVDLLQKVLERQEKVTLVLDGLDECQDNEASLIFDIIRRLQDNSKLLTCVSQRHGIGASEHKMKAWDTQRVIKVPEDNPDIARFIEEELNRRIESGKLVLGHLDLRTHIKETLQEGAHGMFLWVALQFDSICSERTDAEIYRALRNLPPDLSTTFCRILERADPCVRNRQKNILKLVVGAHRPLDRPEFREALSVTPGDPSWAPERMINDVEAALACCGSLLVIDEEEHTIRLIHQSVAQFVLNSTATSAVWHFTFQEAYGYVGDISVTYLNYGVFDSRVSTKVVHKMETSETPGKIVELALQPYGLLGQAAMMYLLPQRTSSRDIGQFLSKTAASYRRRDRVAETFHFLQYAMDNWLFHSREISSLSPMYSLWKQLVNHPRFGKLVWDPTSSSPVSDELAIDEASGMMWHLVPRVTWSIFYSHLPLLSLALGDRHGVRSVCSIVPYLTNLMQAEIIPQLTDAMFLKLLRVSTTFKAGAVTAWLLRLRGLTIDQYFDFIRTAKTEDYSTMRWIIFEPAFGRLDECEVPFVEETCARGDTEAMARAVRRGANVNVFKYLHPLAKVAHYRNEIQKPETMYTAYLLLRAEPPAPISVLSYRALYMLLHGFANHTNLDKIKHLSLVATDPVSGSKTALDHKKLLQRACKGGDYIMVRMVLPLVQPIETFHDFLPIVEAALFARSRDRTRIVKKLLGWIKAPLQPFPIEQSSRLMLRCLYLRDWTSAEHVLRILGANDTFKKYARTEQLMHFCTDAGDFEGVQFLHKYADIDICEDLAAFKVTLGNKIHFDQSPLDLALVKTPSSLGDAETLMKIAAYMWANIPEPPHYISWRPDLRLSYHLLIESSINRCTSILQTFIVPGCQVDETMVSILRLMQQMLGDVPIIELDNAGLENEYTILRVGLQVKLTNAFEATLVGYSNISKASQQSCEHDAVAAALVSLTDWILQVYKRSGFIYFGLRKLVPEFSKEVHTDGGMSRVLNRHGLSFATGNSQPWA